MNFDFDFDFDFDFENLFAGKQENINQVKIINKPKNFYEFVIGYYEYIKAGLNFDEFFYKDLTTKFENLNSSHDIDTLLIIAPPGIGKTFILLMDIVYSAVNEPKRALDYEYLFVCGSNKLKKKLNYDIKKALSSDYVKLVYGNQFNSKDCVKNQEMIIISSGLRMVFQTTMAQDPKGSRYKRIYLIDYFTGNMFRSKADRETGFENLGAILTRTQVGRDGLNENSSIEDIIQTKLIVDNQRLGSGDVAERFIENYNSAGVPFFQSYFPYQFDENFTEADKRTYKRLNNKGEELETYIYEENQFVVKRFNEKTKRKLIADQGEKRYRIEYQGLVDTIDGEIFDDSYFVFYDSITFSNTHFTKLIITIDTALKIKETSDYSVISLWGLGANRGIFLIDIVQGKWLANVLEVKLEMFIEKWKNGVNGTRLNLVRMEDTANGSVTLNSINHKSSPITTRINELLASRGIKLEGYNPKSGKYHRLSAFLKLLSDNKIYLPSSNFTANVPYSSVMSFKQQAIEFTADDTHKNDDMVDTMITALEYLYAKPNTITIGYQARYENY